MKRHRLFLKTLFYPLSYVLFFAILLLGMQSNLIAQTDDNNDDEDKHILEGIASFYSDKYHGRLTANQEVFDQSKVTAAHKTLPFGTWVKVIRQDDNDYIYVRINDRGPFVEGRVIDLSLSAANRLGIIKDGMVPVHLEILTQIPLDYKGEMNDSIFTAFMSNTSMDMDKAVKFYTESGHIHEDNIIRLTSVPKKIKEQKIKFPKKWTKGQTHHQPKNEWSEENITYRPYSNMIVADTIPINTREDGRKGTYTMSAQDIGFGYQVASFQQYSNALKHFQSLKDKGYENVLVVEEHLRPNITVYRVVLGPYPDIYIASDEVKYFEKQKQLKGFVISFTGEQIKHL